MRKLIFIGFAFFVTTTFGQKLQDFRKDESWYDFKNLKSSKNKLSDFVKNFKEELDLTYQEELRESRKEKDITG